ncbi:MAG: hypothetical protein V4592_10090 [Bacteroidota bacterium]
MKLNITYKNIRLLICLLLISSTVFGQRGQILTKSVGKTAIGCAAGDLNINVTQGSDAQGCFYDVEYKPIWSLTASQFCDINQAPHGFYVEFSGATIASSPIRTGAWLAGAVQTPASPTGNFVYFNKQPAGTCPLPTSAIPSGQLQKARIRINPGTGPVTVVVRTLIGQSWPNTWAPPIPANAAGWLPPGNQPYSGVWDCGTSFIFTPPTQNYNIGTNTSVCSGAFATLNLSPAPPAGSQVTWYRSGTNIACPSTTPWDVAGWGTAAQTSGNSFPTNALTHTECFVAVVKQGCWSYVSNVKTITVCNGAPGATIATTPTGANAALQLINNQYHACIQWQGKLNLTLSPTSCPATITWEKKPTSLNTWTTISTTGSPTQINTGLLYLLSSVGCNSGYDFRAKLVNACGTTYVPITIMIDNHPVPGQIHTQSTSFYDVGTGTSIAPILCNKMGTQLVEIPTCGTIDHWEYQHETAPCSGIFTSWQTIPGSGTTSTWWTGNLTATTKYRAAIKNGACGTVPSTAITVKVRPELLVSIAQPASPLLCTNPVLTAATSYDGCNSSTVNYPLTYQWYQDGVPIAGVNATHKTYTPLKPGNYSVVVSDGTCKTETKSNVVTLCAPTLVVAQSSCCVCSATDVVSLSAVITGNCGPMPTYTWSNGATTASISVTVAGTYAVTVHFPGTSTACNLHASAIVGNCAH